MTAIMTAVPVEVRRLAIKFEPPTLVVEYIKNQKIYVKKIKLKTTEAAGTKGEEEHIRVLTDLIIEKNADVLGPELVSREQIEDLVRMIMKKKVDRPTAIGIDAGNMYTSTNNQISNTQLDPFGDLNKASDDIVARAKETMSVDFEAKRVKPGDPEYVYEKNMDFAPPSGVSDWDDEEED